MHWICKYTQEKCLLRSRRFGERSFVRYEDVFHDLGKGIKAERMQKIHYTCCFLFCLSVSKWTTLFYTQSLWNGKCFRILYTRWGFRLSSPPSLHYPNISSDHLCLFSNHDFGQIAAAQWGNRVSAIRNGSFSSAGLILLPVCTGVMNCVLACLSSALELALSRWIDILWNKEEC